MKQPYWEGKTVMVTGGLGFIGSHFVEELLSSGAKVICLYRTANQDTSFLPVTSRLSLVQLDLLDRAELMAACKYIAPKIDTLIHCAALDGNTEFKLQNAARILDSNLRMTSNVLGCAHETQVDNVILISSAEIYSPTAKSPILEEDDYKKQLGYRENGYVLSKIFAEVLAELHKKQFGMNIFLPRPTNVYGPRDNFDEATNRVIPSMMKKIAAGQPIEIWGDGSQTRSFIYVKDLVKATLKMIELNKQGVINMATKDQVSIIELARMICELHNSTERIHLDNSKPTGVQGRELNTERLYSMIDFDLTPLKKGLEQTFQWHSNTKPLGIKKGSL
jgi:dTDP-4-dehydro-6-deoxy-alpha-D-gulose 4-ketoreductase